MGDPADRRWAQSIATKPFVTGYVKGLGDPDWRVKESAMLCVPWRLHQAVGVLQL